VYDCAAHSPHIVDVELFQQGLHDIPSHLRVDLQTHIAGAVGQGYDAVVLSYGLCGKSIEGLKAREVPLVVPRAHDCITLFLGSRARYQQEFEKNPGTYWFASDYVERSKRPGTTLTMGAIGPNADMQMLYEQYVAKYGKDNADYLMEVMGEWSKHYRRAAFVDMGVGDASSAERQARENAEKRGWTFERVVGDTVLIRRLLDADWEKDFMVLQPGEEIAISCDEQIICQVRGNQ